MISGRCGLSVFCGSSCAPSDQLPQTGAPDALRMPGFSTVKPQPAGGSLRRLSVFPLWLRDMCDSTSRSQGGLKAQSSLSV